MPRALARSILRNSVYLDELGPELKVATTSGVLLSVTGGHTMNWAPRADQAAAIAAAVAGDDHLGRTYDLVSPEPYTYDDLADLLSEATGKSIVHRSAPPHEVVQALIHGGLDADHAESIVHLFQRAIATDACRTTGSDIEHLSGASGRPTPAYLAGLAARG